MKLSLALLVLLAVTACTGCPHPTAPPITVVGLDGSVITVTDDTACTNLQSKCGTPLAQCLQQMTDLAGSPLDTPCMTTAPTRDVAAKCVGVGTLCALADGGS